MIPDDLQHVHKLVLQLRDRVFAHHDKTSRVIDEASGEDLSQLVIRIRNGVIAPGIQTVFPTGAQLTNMLRLCRVLYDRCKAKGAVALGKCTTTPPPDGIYTVSTVFEGRAPLFTPMKTIKRTDSGQTKDAHGSR